MTGGAMPEFITRREALDRGLKRYFTGRPCKYGHVAERWVSTSGCTECGQRRGQTLEHREAARRYRQTPERREAQLLRNRTPARKEYERHRNLERKAARKGIQAALRAGA